MMEVAEEIETKTYNPFSRISPVQYVESDDAVPVDAGILWWKELVEKVGFEPGMK